MRGLGVGHELAGRDHRGRFHTVLAHEVAEEVGQRRPARGTPRAEAVVGVADARNGEPGVRVQVSITVGLLDVGGEGWRGGGRGRGAAGRGRCQSAEQRPPGPVSGPPRRSASRARGPRRTAAPAPGHQPALDLAVEHRRVGHRSVAEGRGPVVRRACRPARCCGRAAGQRRAIPKSHADSPVSRQVAWRRQATAKVSATTSIAPRGPRARRRAVESSVDGKAGCGRRPRKSSSRGRGGGSVGQRGRSPCAAVTHLHVRIGPSVTGTSSGASSVTGAGLGAGDPLLAVGEDLPLPDRQPLLHLGRRARQAANAWPRWEALRRRPARRRRCPAGRCGARRRLRARRGGRANSSASSVITSAADGWPMCSSSVTERPPAGRARRCWARRRRPMALPGDGVLVLGHRERRVHHLRDHEPKVPAPVPAIAALTAGGRRDVEAGRIGQPGAV